MDFNWWGVPGTLTWIAAWVAAVVVVRSAPARTLNRRLAVVFILEGLWQAGSTGIIFLVTNRHAAYSLAVLGTIAQATLPLAYLAFLGAALETRLVRPFRGRAATTGLAALGVLATFSIWLFPERFVTALYHPGWATWNFQLHGLGVVSTQLHGVVALFSLVAVLSEYRHTLPGTAARARAKWFAIAFGVVDVYVGSFQFLYPYVRPVRFWGDFIYNPGIGIVYLVFVSLLAYAVLHVQLFDFNLKLKIALERSTVAGIIAAAFFIGSEVLESFIPVDSTLLGLAAAGVIVLALRPLQRLAEMLTNQLMPGVTDTSAYLDNRKDAVYMAALEGALKDGVVTDKERAILASLAQHLKLSDAATARIESELAARPGRQF